MQRSQPALAAAGHRRDCGKPVCCCHRAGQGAAMTSFDLSAIDTPALVLDEARMRANIRRLAERLVPFDVVPRPHLRSEEHTSELQSLMRISYDGFCLTKKIKHPYQQLRMIT